MIRISNFSSERGAVLVQTAVAALVLVGFGTFVVDYGVLWVARHQAQNAADAGAMAGALARAYEDFDDPPAPAGIAAQFAQQQAGANLVWGQSSPQTASTVTFEGACPPEAGAASRCVQVNVYRNGEQGSTPLPAWFTPALGLAPTQGVRATARARVFVSNATKCLRPWAIPDKWVEPVGPPPDPSFKKYDETTGAELPAPHDEYDPPTALATGSGYTFATGNSPGESGDFGISLGLNFSTDPTNSTDLILPGWLVALEPPGGYLPSVIGCNGHEFGVGDQVSLAPSPPLPIHFNELYGRDLDATWSAASRSIMDSCAPVCAPLSPRLVAVAVFDTELFQYRRALKDWTACLPGRPGCTPCPVGGTACVSIVNIVGLFIDDAFGATGRLMTYPGVIPTQPPKLSAASSFLKAITLVR